MSDAAASNTTTPTSLPVPLNLASDVSTIIAVFAKPARPGEVKTRLAAEHGPVVAAALAHAFFCDTWASVSSLPWARPIVATTDVGAEQWSSLPPTRVWSQGQGDLGQRIERVVCRALEQANQVIVIGSDTPGLSLSLLEQAAAMLATTDAVLGPCDDGGFYILGMRRCVRGLFSELPWSEPSTFVAAQARLRAQGLSVEQLATWFDVDRPNDLRRLQQLIECGLLTAPRTAACLAAQLGARRGAGRG